MRSSCSRLSHLLQAIYRLSLISGLGQGFKGCNGAKKKLMTITMMRTLMMAMQIIEKLKKNMRIISKGNETFQGFTLLLI